jgi:lipoate-protein ligase A
MGAQAVKPFVFTYLQETIEVVYGPACKPDIEIRRERCALDGVPIIKRRGGGGTVALSPGMVVTVIVGERQKGGGALEIFSSIHDAMIALLETQGIAGLEKTGISDVAIAGKKVLGSSLYLQHEPFFYYYQSSLLVAPDNSLFDKYLNYPPREPLYRKGRTHGDFCTTLSRHAPQLSPQAVACLFNGELPHRLVAVSELSTRRV